MAAAQSHRSSEICQLTSPLLTESTKINDMQPPSKVRWTPSSGLPDSFNRPRSASCGHKRRDLILCSGHRYS